MVWRIYHNLNQSNSILLIFYSIDAQVIIRIRPLSSAEISVQGYSRCVRQDSCQTITWTGHPESRFTFDLVADENVSQVNSNWLYSFLVGEIYSSQASFLWFIRRCYLNWLVCLWWRTAWEVTIAACLPMAKSVTSPISLFLIGFSFSLIFILRMVKGLFIYVEISSIELSLEVDFFLCLDSRGILSVVLLLWLSLFSVLSLSFIDNTFFTSSLIWWVASDAPFFFLLFYCRLEVERLTQCLGTLREAPEGTVSIVGWHPESLNTCFLVFKRYVLLGLKIHFKFETDKKSWVSYGKKYFFRMVFF